MDENGDIKPCPLTVEEIRAWDAKHGIKYRRKSTISRLTQSNSLVQAVTGPTQASIRAVHSSTDTEVQWYDVTDSIDNVAQFETDEGVSGLESGAVLDNSISRKTNKN
jgi:hypothetical protein